MDENPVGFLDELFPEMGKAFCVSLASVAGLLVGGYAISGVVGYVKARKDKKAEILATEET